MAKLIYGVSGEGSGHSSRARLIAGHLVSQGHKVSIVSYNRGYRNLKGDFECLEIVGLTIVSFDNEVFKLKTITANLANIPKGKAALSTLHKLFHDFDPDCVITDFEPCTAYLANHYDLPLISLDNQHRMRYMKYDRPDGLPKEATMTEVIIKAMVPRPWVSLITSFHTGTLKNERSFVFTTHSARVDSATCAGAARPYSGLCHLGFRIAAVSTVKVPARNLRRLWL